jgi:hypothetical protein
MHLVGFIIRIYHDARPSEYQSSKNVSFDMMSQYIFNFSMNYKSSYKTCIKTSCISSVSRSFTRKIFKYRVIHKFLRDFRPLRYSIRDGHAEGENVNRERDTPRFCPILQVLHMSTLGDAADVNPVIKFQTHTVNHVA